MLLAILKDVRKSVAKKANLPTWIVCQDQSLEDMSIMYPITLDELKNCQGVGEGKAKKFGKEFVSLIEKYVKENDIIRPDDFVLRTAANKSAVKVFIIQSIDRKMPFEDIARAKDMDMEELIEKLRIL